MVRSAARSAFASETSFVHPTVAWPAALASSTSTTLHQFPPQMAVEIMRVLAQRLEKTTRQLREAVAHN
jgi:hypothetical protein